MEGSVSRGRCLWRTMPVDGVSGRRCSVEDCQWRVVSVEGNVSGGPCQWRVVSGVWCLEGGVSGGQCLEDGVWRMLSGQTDRETYRVATFKNRLPHSDIGYNIQTSVTTFRHQLPQSDMSYHIQTSFTTFRHELPHSEIGYHNQT